MIKQKQKNKESRNHLTKITQAKKKFQAPNCRYNKRTCSMEWLQDPESKTFSQHGEFKIWSPTIMIQIIWTGPVFDF